MAQVSACTYLHRGRQRHPRPLPSGEGWQTEAVKKVLTGVVALALFAAGCGGSSESEELAHTRAELAQTRAELDALKGQVAGRVGLMGTHQTPTTSASPSGAIIRVLSPGIDGSTETFEEFMTGAERREWIRANPLIGLPWRDRWFRR